MDNPASGNMRFRFGMNNASNDWWWAVDNIVVTADVPEPSAAMLMLLSSIGFWRRR